jgi:hypothetical protein
VKPTEAQPVVHPEHPVHRETSDVAIGGIFGFAVTLIVTLVVVSGLVWFFYSYLRREAAQPVPAEFPLATTSMRRLPPEPRLQTEPREDLRTLRESEEQALTTYGWVDKNAGIVRIPIEQAMKLTVERGLPTR